MNELALSNNLKTPDFEVRQFENTKHEIMFASMNPHLKRQVTFGTGKGGLKKWLTKKFTVDFYDEKNKIAYEIDGKSHETELGAVNDKLKEIFLAKKDVVVVRFSNEEVEEAYNSWSRFTLEVFNALFNQH